jgi:REP element-mobilizing transposase RayT
MTKFRPWINQSGSNTYFVTTTLTGFVPLFSDSRYAHVLASAIKHQVTSGLYSLLAFVIMPEHIHLVVYLLQDKPISEVVRALKTWTSHGITEALHAENNESVLRIFAGHARVGAEYAVWQRGFRSFPITNDGVLRQKIRYTHENPVRRELVASPEEYWLSSARVYAGAQDSILEICRPEDCSPS